MTGLKHAFTWQLAAPAARVYSALSEPAELEQWFAEHAEVEPRVGGAYRFWGKHTYGTPSRGDATQSITHIEPGKALGFSWRVHGCDSVVSFVVEPDPDNVEASVLKGKHEFAEAPAIHRAAEMIDDLWRYNWGNLQAHLAGGQGKMRVDFSDERAKIALSVYIDAPPSAVFRTLVDPERIEQWFGVAAAVDPRAGGAWHLKMQLEKDGQTVTAPPCEILEFVENERLTISWPDWRGDETVPDQRVGWILTPEGSGTRVDFCHDGFVRAVDVSDYPFGWGYFLSRITAVAEGQSLPTRTSLEC